MYRGRGVSCSITPDSTPAPASEVSGASYMLLGLGQETSRLCKSLKNDTFIRMLPAEVLSPKQLCLGPD